MFSAKRAAHAISKCDKDGAGAPRHFKLVSRVKHYFRPYLTYLIAFALAAAALTGIWVIEQPAPGTLSYELCKLLLQFLVVVVVGGGLKYGIDQHQAARDQRAKELDVLRGVLGQLSESYTSIKRIRRETGIEISGDGTLAFEVYRKTISDLINVQLELEALNEDIKITMKGPGDTPDTVYRCVKLMEEYLKSVSDGSRDSHRAGLVENAQVQIDRLSDAERAFLSEERHNNPWYLRFVMPLREARQALHHAASRL